MGVDLTLPSWVAAREKAKEEIREVLSEINFDADFKIGLTEVNDLGLSIAGGEWTIDDHVIKTLFGRDAEIVATCDDVEDYHWDEWSIVKVKRWVYNKEEKKGEILDFNLKFSGHGASHGGSYYKGWSFVEPKTETVEVWE